MLKYGIRQPIQETHNVSLNFDSYVGFGALPILQRSGTLHLSNGSELDRSLKIISAKDHERGINTAADLDAFRVFLTDKVKGTKYDLSGEVEFILGRLKRRSSVDDMLDNSVFKFDFKNGKDPDQFEVKLYCQEDEVRLLLRFKRSPLTESR